MIFCKNEMSLENTHEIRATLNVLSLFHYTFKSNLTESSPLSKACVLAMLFS